MSTLDEIKDDVQILFDQYASTKLPNFLDIFDKAIDVYYMIENKDINIYPLNKDNIFVNVDHKKINIPGYIFKKGAESIKYFSYKNNLSKRQMAIPNPIWYFAFVFNIIQLSGIWLEKFYHENKGILIHSNSPILGRQNFLRLSYDENDGFFFEQILSGLTNEKSVNKSYKMNQEKSMSIEGTNPLYLKTDIESYFDNIYTHQLSILKKFEPFKTEIMKTPEIQFFFDFLDTFNMSINDNHTKGILQGPISSSISAEFLGIYIDFEIDKFHNKFVRYVDDFIFFDKDYSSLDKAIERIDKIFRSVGVRRNQSKTEIAKGFPKIKQADLTAIINRFEFLNKSKKINLKVSDLKDIRNFLKEMYVDENIPQIRSFLTNFSNYLDRVYKNRNLDISQSIYIIPILLKIVYVFPVVSGHIYKTIEIILIKSSIKEQNQILKVLENDTEYINSNFSDSDIQIWHYFLLANYSKESSRKLIGQKFLKENKNFKYTVDSIIVSFFIKKNFKENCIFFDYIEYIYCEENDNQSNLNGIGSSRWWIALYRLYLYFSDDKVYNSYQSKKDRNLTKKFFEYRSKVCTLFEKSKHPNYSELGILSHLK